MLRLWITHSDYEPYYLGIVPDLDWYKMVQGMVFHGRPISNRMGPSRISRACVGPLPTPPNKNCR